MMAELGAEVLVPEPTMPVRGADKMREVLTTTRAAIEHVMQYTSDRMDEGLPMEDIAATITLPDDLAGLPWLGEFYGKIGWSARAFAVGTLGWYDGNPIHLGAMSTNRQATHIARLAGGIDALMQDTRETDNLQWRLELCDHLIALGVPAEGLKAEAMEALAEIEINATARNTYLWEARQQLRDAEKENG